MVTTVVKIVVPDTVAPKLHWLGARVPEGQYLVELVGILIPAAFYFLSLVTIGSYTIFDSMFEGPRLRKTPV